MLTAPSLPFCHTPLVIEPLSIPMPPHADPDPRPAAGAIGWQERLDQCHSVAEVVEAVKDHLARLTPDEIATMPQACRPGRVVDADDVAEYALQLARAQCEASSVLLDKLSGFMTHASLRLAQILAAVEAVSEDAPR